MQKHIDSASDTQTGISRGELQKTLRAARRAQQHRFARNLAEAWLDRYPGDLEVSLAHAEAQWADGRADQAVLTLKRICNFDPELLPAQVMLAHLSTREQLPQAAVSLGNVAALTGKFSTESSLPSWATDLLSITQTPENDINRRIEALLDLVGSEPPSPIPSLFLLHAYRESQNTQSFHGWGHAMVERWPDCLVFRLVEADQLLANGEEELAVRKLHEIAAQDVSAVVANRFYGNENPYRQIWPTSLHLDLQIQIPAEVSLFMGRNQLPAGARKTTHSPSAMSATDSHQAGPSVSEEWIEIRGELDRLAETLNRPDLAHSDGRFPTMVIISSMIRLKDQYGMEAFTQIDAEIRNLVQATRGTNRWGSHALYVDDHETCENLGLGAVSKIDPWQIKHLLHDLDKSLASSGERIGALLIVGGHDILPFHMLPNPVDDDDKQVPSDNPYASFDENYFIPLWPVGRLPTSEGRNPKLLIQQIREIAGSRASSTGNHGLLQRFLEIVVAVFKRQSPGASKGITAQVWQRASHAVFRTIGSPQKLSISPSSIPDTEITAFKNVKLGYFNLHGLADAPEWFGQRDPLETPEGVDYPVALHPDALDLPGKSPNIAFSEACYGANIFGKKVEESIALKMLTTGSRAFVGSTCISYGSITTPLIAADLLGKYFWSLLKEGLTVGEALFRAKVHLAREMDRRQGYLDGEDQKTLISFVLYGDPLAVFDPLAPRPKVFPRERSGYNPTTVCDLSDSQYSENRKVPEELLAQVKAVVKGYLPGMSGANILVSSEHIECTGHDCPTRHIHAKTSSMEEPQRKVVKLSKQVVSGGFSHKQLARITLDKSGEVVKLVVSR